MTCIAHDGEPFPLFEYAREMGLAALAASPLGALRPGEKVADLFCGAGGWGEGGKLCGLRVDFAINHSPEAITTHARNNPGCRHHLGDAWKARPREVIGEGTRLGLLLASAACTTHSRAKGSAPVSKRVHMLGWCIARWMEEAQPRLVLIENVPEWKDWGPLIAKRDENGRELRDAQGRLIRVQDPRRKGQHFRRWWRYCERLGYVMEMRVLDAPDYGEASRRRRLFVIARRDGQPICWPEVTHGSTVEATALGVRFQGKNPGAAHEPGAWVHALQDPRDRPKSKGAHVAVRRNGHQAGGCERVHARELRPCRTAADIIDWSDLGKSIFGRKQALKPKTQARIAEGIRRYVIADADPFVLRVTHGEGSWKVSPIDAPLPTQTTGTVTTLDRHGLVGVMLGLSAAGAARALETAAWLRKHLGDAVPIEPETGLAYTVIGGVRRYFIDILFRMLRALELAAAMGFPADYVWPRTRTGSINQRVAVRMIGNAVSVRTARARIASVLPGLAATQRKAVRA